jgi:large subunit ribosomal protein L19
MTHVLSPVHIESRKNLDLRSGDTVRVHQKIEEKGKTRIQVFEGLVIGRKHGSEAGGTFTVRRSTGGYPVEKIYPLYSPMIDKIEITKRSKVRRSKLYYIRRKALKQISKRMKMMFININDDVKEEDMPEEAEQVELETPITDTPAAEVASEEEVVATETPAEEVVAEAPAEESAEQK